MLTKAGLETAPDKSGWEISPKHEVLNRARDLGLFCGISQALFFVWSSKKCLGISIIIKDKFMFEKYKEKLKKIFQEQFQRPKSLKNREWLFAEDFRFETLEVYVDEEHIMRELVRHIPSGELYYHEWYEKIDWVNGNDPQYNMYIPVESAEEAREQSDPEMTYFGGSAYTPRIINNLYADDTTEMRWVREDENN